MYLQIKNLNMEQNAVKRKGWKVLVTTLVAFAGLLWMTILPSCSGSGTGGSVDTTGTVRPTTPIRGVNICNTSESQAMPQAWTARHDPSAKNADFNVAFKFENWCTRKLPDEKACQCRWYIDSLVLNNWNGSVPWGDTVRVSWPIKLRDDFTDRTIELVLAKVIDLHGYNVSIYEGSVIRFSLPGTIDPLGFELAPGGLCVIENVDGGDGPMADL